MSIWLFLVIMTGIGPSSGADTSRIQSLLESGKFYLAKQTATGIKQDSAAFFFLKAISLSDSFHLPAYKKESVCLLGETYLKTGNEEQGTKCFQEVLKSYRSSGDRQGEAQTWFNLALIYRSVNLSSSKSLEGLEQALFLFRETGNKEKEIEVLEQIAFTHYYQEKIGLAEEESLHLLDTCRSSGHQRPPRIYLLLSNISRYRGDFNKSLLYALEGVKCAEETGDTSRYDALYGELGLVYQELGQTSKSIDYYRKTLEIREKRHASKLFIYRTAAFLCQELIKEKKEKAALKMMLDLSKKDPPLLPLEKASLAQIIGDCYNAMKQFKLAEKYYLDMIALYANIETDLDGVEFGSMARQDIGKFYIEQGSFEKARPYLMKSLEAAHKANTLSRVKDLHLMLYRIDSASGNFLSAIQHFRQHKDISDSIFNETKSKQIEELQIRYETGKKDKEILLNQQNIQLLTRQGILQQNELKQANLVRDLTLGGVFLLLIIVFLLYKGNRLKQKNNKLLETQQKEIQDKNIFLQRLVNEKEWLLKEIHHRVKNNLQIVMSLLNSQSAYLDNEAALAAIRNSQRRVHAISLIHQKLYQTNDVSSINMEVYVRELAEFLQDSFSTGQKIHFEVEVSPVELDVSQAVPLGLILNEAITNSIKYAFPDNRTGTIHLSLKSQEDDHLLFIIEDNGIGLPAGFDSRQPLSLGMSLMKGLSQELSGSFTIEQDKGTRIKIKFKYDQSTRNRLNIA